MELILERLFVERRELKQGGYDSVSSFCAEALGACVPKQMRSDDRLVSQLSRRDLR